jgi:hypothetical protein
MPPCDRLQPGSGNPTVVKTRNPLRTYSCLFKSGAGNKWQDFGEIQRKNDKYDSNFVQVSGKIGKNSEKM